MSRSRRTGVLVANGPEIALQAAAAARPAVPIVMLDAVGGSSAGQVFTQRAPNLGALAVDALNVFLFWVSSRDASPLGGVDYDLENEEAQGQYQFLRSPRAAGKAPVISGLRGRGTVENRNPDLSNSSRVNSA